MKEPSCRNTSPLIFHRPVKHEVQADKTKMYLGNIKLTHNVSSQEDHAIKIKIGKILIVMSELLPLKKKLVI